jgi:serine/threonine protein phosphatase PrpC
MRGQDRALALDLASTVLLAVADGAGGTSHGGEAATYVLDQIEQAAAQLGAQPLRSLESMLRTLDGELAERIGGQTTLVVAVIRAGFVWGVSVGDSACWVVRRSGEHVDLTAQQVRKPLLGDGCAVATTFQASMETGDLVLVATDGLGKYVSAKVIRDACAAIEETAALAESLVRLPQLPNGDVPDDVAVALARIDADDA